MPRIAAPLRFASLQQSTTAGNSYLYELCKMHIVFNGSLKLLMMEAALLNGYPILELERVGERHLIPSRLDWRILLVLAQMGGWEPHHWLDYDSVYLQLPGVAISPREAFQIGKALE